MKTSGSKDGEGSKMKGIRTKAGWLVMAAALMAGTATEHFNWEVSIVKTSADRDVHRWTLTHK